MSDWYPNAVREPGNSGGSFIGVPARGVLHTTEGSSYAGALGAYRANNSWPHLTVTYEGQRFGCFQHLPVSVAARALKHPAGTVETNRANAIQIEIVGRAATITSMPVGYKDGLRDLMRWIEVNANVARRSAVQFVANAGNSVRLTSSRWNTYSGWCGHMHVPSNDHTDPGQIDIAYLLAGPPPIPSPTLEAAMYLAHVPASGAIYLVGFYGKRYIGNVSEFYTYAALGVPVKDLSAWDVAQIPDDPR